MIDPVNSIVFTISRICFTMKSIYFYNSFFTLNVRFNRVFIFKGAGFNDLNTFNIRQDMKNNFTFIYYMLTNTFFVFFFQSRIWKEEMRWKRRVKKCFLLWRNKIRCNLNLQTNNEIKFINISYWLYGDKILIWQYLAKH